MARLEDLLRDYEVSELNDYALVAEAAGVCGLSVFDFRTLVADKGNGMLYSSKCILKDTPEYRKFLLRMFGEVVAVSKDGAISIVVADPVKRECYWRNEKAKNRKRRAKARERAERENVHEREQIFRDCQTHPSPKRGGRANSHDDIGKYVNRHYVTMDALQPRSKDVLITIKINL